MDNNDIRRLYSDVLCLYRGIPVKVLEVDGDTIVLHNLMFDKQIKVKFVQENFSPPRGRIGYVNHGAHTYYVKRRPVRKFQNGLALGNIHVSSPTAAFDIPLVIRKLMSVGFVNAMMNVYPSLKECIEATRAGRVYSMAFDKQFWLTHDGKVLYKTECVGSLVDNEIVFNEGREYLRGLIGVSYEKSF